MCGTQNRSGPNIIVSENPNALFPNSEFRNESQKPKPTAAADDDVAALPTATSASRERCLCFHLAFLFDCNSLWIRCRKSSSPQLWRSGGSSSRRWAGATIAAPPPFAFFFFCFFAGPEKWKANWRVESGPGQASSERRNHRSGMQQIFEIPLFHMPKLFQEKLRQDYYR